MQRATSRMIEDGSIYDIDIADEANIQLSKILWPTIRFVETICRRANNLVSVRPINTSVFFVTPIWIHGRLTLNAFTIHTTDLSGLGSITNPEIEVGLYDNNGNLIAKRSIVDSSIKDGVFRLTVSESKDLLPGQYYVAIYSGHTDLAIRSGQSLDALGQIPHHGTLNAGSSASNRLPSSIDLNSLTLRTTAAPWVLLD